MVNSVDHGRTSTEIRGYGGRQIKEGAKGIVWTATLPDNGPTGGFFYDCKPELW